MASWILFGASCLLALFTINAFFPVRRNKVLFLPSFFASWLTIELVWWHLIWEAAGAVALVWFGALDRPIGWVGLGIFVVNWLALASILVAGRGSGAAATAALEALDDDEYDTVHRGRVKRIKNLTYRRVAGKSIRLDVFAPAHPPAPGVKRPAVLQIHGGAWVIGDKREQGIPLLKLLASHGWVGFNANYRLSPGATWPDHLVDLKHAVAWIREHADEYDVDPNFIAVTGGSAGGHLAAMMALTANDPRYQAGIEHADTSLQVAVPFYGVYDFTNRNDTMPDEFVQRFLEPLVMKTFLDEDPEAFAAASPLDCVGPDAPPFLVIHGDNDTLAPVEDAREFAKRLGDVSESSVFYLELKGAQHAFDVFTSVRTRRVIRAVHHFLAVMHARYLRGIPEEVAPPESQMVEGAVRVDEASDVERAAAS
jgi:acetyl esterase/lipase